MADIQAGPSSDTGPASTLLSEKAAQLSMKEQKEASEAERLREEIFASRKARQDRAATAATSRSPQSLDAGSNTAMSSTSGSSPNSIKPTSTSFAVSAGSTSPSGAPTSLAHFIGGSRAVNGPVLNKNRPDHQDGAGLETDDLSKPTATFLSKNKDALMQSAHFNREKRFVAMPGMTKPGSSAPSSLAKSQTDPLPTSRAEQNDIAREGSADERKKGYGVGASGSSATSSGSTPTATPQYGIQRTASPAQMPKPTSPSSNDRSAGIVREGTAEERKRGYGVVGSSSTPAWVSMPKFEMSRPANATQSEIVREGTAAERKRGYGVGSSSSVSSSTSAQKQDASPQGSLSPPIGTSDVLPSRSPTIPTSLTFDAVSSAKSQPAVPAPKQEDNEGSNGRPSVIRLQGSNIVKDRLKWGEAQSSNSASGAKAESALGTTSPQMGTDKQTKRSSVLDRWGRDSPNTSAANQNVSVGSSPARATSLPGLSAPTVESTSSKPSLAPKPASRTASLEKPAETEPVGSFITEPAVTDLPKLDISDLEKQAGIADGSIQTSPMSTTQPTSATSARSPQSASSAVWSRPLPGSPASSKPVGRVGAAVAATTSLPISVSPVPYQRATAPSSPRTYGTQRNESQTSSPPANAFAAARNVFQPSSTSFAVSSGNASSDGRPTSLAHFIGGSSKVTGPVLNKHRPETMDGAGMETDDFARPTATFLSKNKDDVMKGLQGHHFQRGNKAGVALPRMVKVSPKAHEEVTPKVDEQEVKDALERTQTPLIPLAEAVEKESIDLKVDPASSENPKSGERLPSPIAPSSFIPSVAAAPQNYRVPPGPSATSTISQSSSPMSAVPSVRANTYIPSVLDQTSTLRHMQAWQQPKPMAKRKSIETVSASHDQRGRSIDATAQSKMQTGAGKAASTRGMAFALRNKLQSPTAAPAATMRDLDAEAQRAKADAIMKRFAGAGAMSGSAEDGEDWQGTVSKWTNPVRRAPLPPEASNISPPSKGLFVVPEPPITRLPDVDPSIFETVSRPKRQKTSYLSVDVLSIQDDYATTLKPEQAPIFHSTEILCIVLRSKEGGLVSTQLLVWHGKHSQAVQSDGPEQRKINELQDRYRTIASHITQGSEPDELVAALGDRLVIRHGARSAFDVLNSTMYRVQIIGDDMIIIDEVDMEIAALCSAYSYIASVFEDLFVWHGIGSTQRERNAAVHFAMELAQDSDSGTRDVSEVEEGHESDLFKDILGEGHYASAHHWRLRSHQSHRDIRIFAVDDTHQVTQIKPSTASADTKQGILLVVLPYEAYVVVPPDCRALRQDIALAIAAGRAYRNLRRHKDPHFVLPVHTLVLPSVIPADLAAYFRSSWLNDLNTSSGDFTMNTHVPVTMNVVDDETALAHLASTSFERGEVVEIDILPVGIAPHMLR